MFSNLSRHSVVHTLWIFSLIAVLGGCGGADKAPGESGKPGGPGGPGGGGGPPPAEVEFITVDHTDVARTIELPGRLRAIRVAQVRARVEGIVEKRLYVEGTDVIAGAPLFQIDARTLAVNVDAAKAAVARARADAFLAEQTLERVQNLFKENQVSKQELDQATARQQQTAADVAAAQAVRARAEIDLNYATVTAPISGHVGRALVTEGALVGKGEATSMATIVQLDPIWVDLSQSSRDFLRLRETVQSQAHRPNDAAAHLMLETGREYQHTGKFLFTDLIIDPNTGSVGLHAEFPNPKRALLPGQFVTVRLAVAFADNAIVVPQRAVQASTQGQFVLVVGPDNKVISQPVKTGGLSGTNWIIVEGLKGGEKVIVDGIQKARPGSVVNPVPAPSQVLPANGTGKEH